MLGGFGISYSFSSNHAERIYVEIGYSSGVIFLPPYPGAPTKEFHGFGFLLGKWIPINHGKLEKGAVLFLGGIQSLDKKVSTNGQMPLQGTADVVDMGPFLPGFASEHPVKTFYRIDQKCGDLLDSSTASCGAIIQDQF